MASEISIGEQCLWVANHRLRSLINFVIEVATDVPTTDQEEEFIAKFMRWDEEEYFPGIGLNLNERFPTTVEKRFWSKIFMNVARRIFSRQLGNQDDESWQCSAIGDAYITARMLTKAIQMETGTSWHPDSEDTLNPQEYYNRINIQL